MNREEGLRVLGGGGWLAQTPPAFRDSLLPLARWHRIEQGAHITLGGEEAEDLIGLASGTAAFTVTLGLPDTPIMHMAHAPYWMGYGHLLRGSGRVVTAQARTTVWIASFPKSKVMPLVDSRPNGWRPFMQLMGIYGDTTALIAADLLIPQSDLRCAAVLLRFGGLRGPGAVQRAQVRVPVTQEELAAAANLSRNSVSVILRRFAARRFVATAYGGIDIIDPAGMGALLHQV